MLNLFFSNGQQSMPALVMSKQTKTSHWSQSIFKVLFSKIWCFFLNYASNYSQRGHKAGYVYSKVM